MNRVLMAVSLFGTGFLSGCINIDVPTPEPKPAPFVIQGTAQSIEGNDFCFVWIADDGTTYVLWQGPNVANSDFDAIVTPGTVARVLLDVRTDLGEPCSSGATVAQINQVKEINGVSIDTEVEALAAQLQSATDNAKNAASEFRANVAVDVTEQVATFKARIAAAEAAAQGDVAAFRAGVNQAVDELAAQIDARAESRRGEFQSAVGAAIEEIITSIEDWIAGLRPRI